VLLQDTQFFSLDNFGGFPPGLSYAGLLSFLSTEDCLFGTFLIETDGDLDFSENDIAADLGRTFYTSGEWRDAVAFLCTARLSGVQVRGDFGQTSLAGIDLSGADLAFSDLSRVNFEETVQVNGETFTLRADLSDVYYNEFTTWPPGFEPPPSAPAPTNQPGGLTGDVQP
jgi:uncharacterized protein YjbI with pentapeptide repeats